MMRTSRARVPPGTEAGSSGWISGATGGLRRTGSVGVDARRMTTVRVTVGSMIVGVTGSGRLRPDDPVRIFANPSRSPLALGSDGRGAGAPGLRLSHV